MPIAYTKKTLNCSFQSVPYLLTRSRQVADHFAEAILQFICHAVPCCRQQLYRYQKNILRVGEKPLIGPYAAYKRLFKYISVVFGIQIAPNPCSTQSRKFSSSHKRIHSGQTATLCLVACFVPQNFQLYRMLFCRSSQRSEIFTDKKDGFLSPHTCNSIERLRLADTHPPPPPKLT